MTPENPGDGKIRITLDDVSRVTVPASSAQGYGNVVENTELPALPDGKASIFLKEWCYLGLAGLGGALLAWCICEPWFRDGSRNSWANVILIPFTLVMSCVGFGIAESIAERSMRKAFIRGLMALGLGTLLGFVFSFIANLIFQIALAIAFSGASGTVNPSSPALWISRGIAWMVFGVAGGVIYGIVGQSGKKCLYGIAGGVVGAGLGGLLFDPIALIASGHAGASRGIGLALFGAATGIAMGLVENALKDRWMYVAAGPLAGKQFILYKPMTTIGSDQSSDIYLFKDPAVQPRHAVIELRGSRAIVHAVGPVNVQGRLVREAMLESGNQVQIGRYRFLYKDRERDRR